MSSIFFFLLLFINISKFFDIFVDISNISLCKIVFCLFIILVLYFFSSSEYVKFDIILNVLGLLLFFILIKDTSFFKYDLSIICEISFGKLCVKIWFIYSSEIPFVKACIL